MAQNLGSLFAQNVSAGLGQGLEALAKNKLKEINEQKAAQAVKTFFPRLTEQEALIISQNPYALKSIFERGLKPEDPQDQKGIIPEALMGNSQKSRGLELGPHPEERRHQETLKQQKELFALKAEQQKELAKIKSETPDPLKVEARKDKLRPDLTYLTDLESTIKEMRNLLKETQDPVSFGYGSSISSSIPVVGNQLLSGNTGTFDALSSKFHTDATQGAKNVRSMYHVKILGKSKPSLDKTQEQNEKLLDYWQKTVDRKKADFLKAHPEFKDEIDQDAHQSEQQVKSFEKKSMDSAQIQYDDQGNPLKWDPKTGKWRPAKLKGT